MEMEAITEMSASVTLRRIARQDELELGTGKVIFIDDNPIALFNIEKEYLAWTTSALTVEDLWDLAR